MKSGWTVLLMRRLCTLRWREARMPGMETISPAWERGDISRAAVVLSRCAVEPLATERERRQEQARALRGEGNDKKESQPI